MLPKRTISLKSLGTGASLGHGLKSHSQSHRISKQLRENGESKQTPTNSSVTGLGLRDIKDLITNDDVHQTKTKGTLLGLKVTRNGY